MNTIVNNTPNGYDDPYMSGKNSSIQFDSDNRTCTYCREEHLLLLLFRHFVIELRLEEGEDVMSASMMKSDYVICEQYKRVDMCK